MRIDRMRNGLGTRRSNYLNTLDWDPAKEAYASSSTHSDGTFDGRVSFTLGRDKDDRRISMSLDQSEALALRNMLDEKLAVLEEMRIGNAGDNDTVIVRTARPATPGEPIPPPPGILQRKAGV